MRQILPRKLYTEADVEAGAHKELFLRYYQPLFRRALRLTDGSRARAEDLLHDAFIQFVLSSPDLNSIDNIDRYLYRLLQNLFRTQKRKAAQMQDISFNIADYDSAKLGLHAIDFQARWQVQEDLVRICHYACVRKETSRAGSVLILRFFYDYSPSEIAKVTLSLRGAVDDWLRLARREARAYLENPERLKFMAGKQEDFYRFKTKPTKSSDDIVYELRASILRSGRSECLPEAQLRALYQDSGQADKTIDSATLGHIISCTRCLDRVNHLLGLPSLSARQAIEKGRSDPDDPDESDNGDGSGTGAGSGPNKAFIDKCEEDLRQIREHRPEELLFSSNGDPIGALKVNSRLSELELSIHDQLPVEFIEVSSERGMRLILFSLEYGENAPVEQRTKIDLSEGRALELIFKLGGTWPSLQVIYRDPLLQEIDYALNDEPMGALALVSDAGPLSDGVESVRLETKAEVAAHPAEVGSEPLITRLSRRLRGLRMQQRRSSRLTMLSISSESQAVHGEPTAQTTTEPANAPGSEDSRFKELRVFELGRAEDLIRDPIWGRPGFITVVFSVLLISALLYLLMPGVTAVNASGLLERARSAEERIDRDPNIVQRRTLDLEERRPADGRIVSRRRVDIWHSAARGVKAQRLYDENHRLIAGQWQKDDGVTMLYRPGAKPQPKIAPTFETLDQDAIWQLDLSAKNFSSLIDRADAATAEETSQSYIIKYRAPESDSSLPAAKVAGATLVLSKYDLHTVDQVLLIEQAGGAREFRFSEASYEQLPVDKVVEGVFEPEFELIGKTNNLERSIKPDSSPLPTNTYAPATAPAKLELEVIRLLNQVDALSGDHVDVIRTPEGGLLIEGILDDDERKQEIVGALASVNDHPAVKIRLETLTEAARRVAQEQSGLPTKPIEYSEFLVASKYPPAYSELRRYFTKHETSDEPVDQVLDRFADSVLRCSRRAARHVGVMKQISTRFSPEQLNKFDEQAIAQWREMLRERVQAFRLEAATLRRQLEPIFLPAGSNGIQSETKFIDDASMASAAERLFDLWLVIDGNLRQSFTVGSTVQTTTSIKLPQFWRSLLSAEDIAAQIQTSIGIRH
jgi:DNA-directed RNA polymerase specialized sigma24 family protein